MGARDDEDCIWIGQFRPSGSLCPPNQLVRFHPCRAVLAFCVLLIQHLHVDHHHKMGTTMGKPLADCAASTLSCAAGEPQEMCSYGGGAPGHRPGQPCDWGDLSSLCTSQLASCECSAPTGIEASALARYTEASPLDAAVVYAGPVMLWTLTLLTWPLYKHLTGWSRTFRPPCAVTSAVSRRAIVVWVALCVGATTALLLAALLLPPAAWGHCAQRGVCVYHMMFCEATRHHSAVRHPANFWSNLPYVYAALGMLCLAADERARRVARPYQLLDLR